MPTPHTGQFPSNAHPPIFSDVSLALLIYDCFFIPTRRKAEGAAPNSAPGWTEAELAAELAAVLWPSALVLGMEGKSQGSTPAPLSTLLSRLLVQLHSSFQATLGNAQIRPPQTSSDCVERAAQTAVFKHSSGRAQTPV